MTSAEKAAVGGIATTRNDRATTEMLRGKRVAALRLPAVLNRVIGFSTSSFDFRSDAEPRPFAVVGTETVFGVTPRPGQYAHDCIGDPPLGGLSPDRLYLGLS